MKYLLQLILVFVFTLFMTQIAHANANKCCIYQRIQAKVDQVCMQKVNENMFANLEQCLISTNSINQYRERRRFIINHCREYDCSPTQRPVDHEAIKRRNASNQKRTNYWTERLSDNSRMNLVNLYTPFFFMDLRGSAAKVGNMGGVMGYLCLEGFDYVGRYLPPIHLGVEYSVSVDWDAAKEDVAIGDDVLDFILGYEHIFMRNGSLMPLSVSGSYRMNENQESGYEFGINTYMEAKRQLGMKYKFSLFAGQSETRDIWLGLGFGLNPLFGSR